MASKFVDANIFLEIFTRLGKKSDRSRRLIQSSSSLCSNLLVFSEVVWVLDSFYEMDKKLIIGCLRKILTSKVEIDEKKLLVNAVNFYEKNNVDWTDCLNVFLLKDKKISKIYSYDKGLNKFGWVKRVEP
ncbi:MAG: PIN domain-containing protein [Patescibacteria group bacterium]|nr:PIN domain-containing protein [Patescibacteria group bacterium]MDP4031147.1 PIN domain-containing protein [Candidatus Beckwithbacteria bacterium]MDZ4228983.1 PIN domain-containing protein [Patescibacteria group bacterium]